MKKKVLSLILTAVLALGILSLAGCSNSAKQLQIAVPNDTTNEARALLLLEANGIIKLKEGAGITATKGDIAENPYNVEIVETEAAQIPNVLKDVDYAVINSNYAINAVSYTHLLQVFRSGQGNCYSAPLLQCPCWEEVLKTRHPDRHRPPGRLLPVLHMHLPLP